MFNVNVLYYQALAAMTGAIGKNWNLVKGVAEGFLSGYSDYLTALATGVEQGLITPADAIVQIKKLPDLLKSDLFAFEIIGAGIIQTAVNSAADILIGAIGTIVPAQTPVITSTTA